MATTERTREITERLERYTIEQIVAFKVNHNDPADILVADRELARRDSQRERLEQHQLDLQLIAKQVRWMKFSALIGVGGTIAGVLLGAWLQWSRSPTPPEPSPSRVQQQSSGTESVDRKEKAESVPLKPPESK